MQLLSASALNKMCTVSTLHADLSFKCSSDYIVHVAAAAAAATTKRPFFQVNWGPVVSFFTYSITGLVEESFFMGVECPFCHPSVSVKALKGTQSINPNQWPGLILLSSITGLLKEAVLLPLHQYQNLIYLFTQTPRVNVCAL